MITSACGTGTARWIGDPSCASTSSAARKPRAKPAPRPAIIDSQTAVVKSAEKGGLAVDDATASMPASLAYQGQEACMFLVDTQGLLSLHGIVSRRQRSGSRRRSRAAGDLVQRLFHTFSGNCSPMQRLSGAGLSRAPFSPASCPISRRDDRQAIRSGEGLRRPVPQALRWSNAPSLLGGKSLGCARDWPRTGRTSTATRSPSSSSRPFDLMRMKTLCRRRACPAG